MVQFKAGSIILLNNDDGNFVSKAVRFFTNSTISHTDFTLGNLVKEESVLSAQTLISVLPLVHYFHDPSYTFTVYEVVILPDDELEKLVHTLYLEYAGTTYGFLQLGWFMYRWAAEKLGYNVKHENNWFPKNVVCSELVYELLLRIAHRAGHEQLLGRLQEWTANTVTPEDIKQIVEAFPDVFRKVAFCDKTKIVLDF